MDLLFVCMDASYPPSNGLTLRTWSVVSGLSACGHQVDVLGFGPEADGARGAAPSRDREALASAAASLSRPGSAVARLRALAGGHAYSVTRFAHPGMREAVARKLASRRYDAVVADTVFAAVNLPQPLSAPLIVNTHNLEHVILQRYAEHEWRPAYRAYAAMEWRRLRQWEQRCWQRAALVLACSEVDRRQIERLCPQVATAVVPNVIETARYAPAGGAVAPRLALYTGSLDWHPNRDAVLYFVEQILPKLRKLAPGTRFVAAGRNPPAELRRQLARRAGVECIGPVDDMRRLLARATVCVVPLRMGSGTRLKILEAAAMAKPIVSTPLGSEGLNFQPGRDLLWASTPDEFAAQTARVLLEPELAERLGQAARRIVVREYGQETLVASLGRALEGLVGGSTATALPMAA